MVPGRHIRDGEPFQIPVGEPATRVLAAREAAPEGEPFLAAALDW